jgi:hypothetical protein
MQDSIRLSSLTLSNPSSGQNTPLDGVWVAGSHDYYIAGLDMRTQMIVTWMKMNETERRVCNEI